ncbi:MAG: ATP-binding cassette domain-containing protein, partial [Gammaproteobacteria bacterium]|nr:ATP-binding cassette domain-containing protein [Gammaproteobacteria bacterium]
TTLAGFEEGEVTVAGYNVDTDPNLVRQAIGYVAQETGVDNFLTGRENLVLQGHLYRMTKKDINNRIDELSKYFDLKGQLDDTVMGYSGGMRRKLDIATALIHRPKVLFLDEPTLGLDTQSRQSLWRYIKELNENLGLTILLTTHYLDEADKLSHRVAIINDGQIKVIDTPDALKDKIQGDSVALEFEKGFQRDANLSERLKKEDFVRDLTWDENKLFLYVTNGAAAIPRVIEITTELSLHPSNVSYARPTLDDVFIKYTGGSMKKEKEEENKWWEKWAGKGNNTKWAKKWQQAQETGEDWEGSQWSAEEAQEWWSQQEENKSSDANSGGEQSQGKGSAKETKEQLDKKGEKPEMSEKDEEKKDGEGENQGFEQSAEEWTGGKWSAEEAKEWWAQQAEKEKNKKDDSKD